MGKVTSHINSSEMLSSIDLINQSRGVNADIASLSSQLADKAKQADLITANDNIAKKADKTYTDNIQTQVNNLVLGAVGSGNNAEVIQARDTFTTLNDRITSVQSSILKRTKNLLNLVTGTISNTGIENWDPGITTYNNTYTVANYYTYPIIGEIEEGKTYKCYDSNGNPATGQSFGWYDANGISLAYTSMSQAGLTAPIGAKFARFSALSNSITQFKTVSENPSFEPYGYKSVALTTDDLFNLDDRLSIRPTILLIFDNGTYDNRSDLLLQYGFKGTFTINNMDDNITGHQNDIKNLFNQGHDIGIYAGTGTRPTTYTGATTVSDAWFQYIKNAVDRLASIGVYLPTFYGCADHKGSQYIYNACQKLGIKYASSVYKLVNGEDWTDPSTVFNSVETNGINNMGLYPYTLPTKTIEDIKSQIDNAVTNNYVLSLFSHNVTDTGSDIECSIAIYTQMLDYIKTLSDSGKLDVLTVRKFYNKYHWDDGKERDYQRVLSGMVNRY
jgi:hypothetical protein